MVVGVDWLPHNDVTRVVMTWQDIIVAVVALVVAVVIAMKVWRLFSCRDTSQCSSCTKECPLRRK